MSQLALIKTDDHWLALPHHCIATIEASSDIKPMWLQQTPWSVIQQRRHCWPVVGLNRQLQPVISEQRTRLVICFKQPVVALRCQEATSIELTDIQAVPAMMQKPDQVIAGLAQFDGQLVLVLEVDILLQRLASVVPALPTGEAVCNVMAGI